MQTVFFWFVVAALFAAALRYLLFAAGRRGRGAGVGAAVLLLLCSGGLLAGEAALRVYQRARRGVPLWMGTNSFADERLGWVGREYLGDLRADRPRILFLGDSFTDGMEVPPEAAYYSEFGRLAGVEVFAYGGRGYGTLQELLALERHLERVRPDLIVLQVCSNDLINNSWELERRSYHQNIAMTRPYQENGRIVYRYPRRLAAPRALLIDHSRVFHLLSIRFETLLLLLAKKGWLSSVEEEIAAGRRAAEFSAAVKTTTELIGEIKQRAGGTPLAAFIADGPEPYFSALRRIFAEQGLPFNAELPALLAREAAAGRRPYLADGTHWNEHGHRVAAAALLSWLQQERRLGLDREA